MTTPNLNLTTFNMLVDPDQSFENYRINLDGPTDSNMTKIDAWSLTIPLLLTSLLVDTTASLVPARNFITNATGSAIASACVVHSVETFFNKIGEFSGSGQADFTGISQAFNHILILGQASGSSASPGFCDVGIDFNGDSTSASYLSVQWGNTGSAVVGQSYNVENIGAFQSSQITVSTITSSSAPGFSGNILAIVPYYSANSGFYKSAMGISTTAYLEPITQISFKNWLMSSIQGGFWISGSPITRIRVFAKSYQSGSGIAKMNFLSGTKISLYGFI